MRIRHFAAVLGLAVMAACGGGGSSPTAPSTPSRAALTITISAVTVTRTPTGYEYGFTVTVRETAGVAATLSGITVAIFNGTTSRGSAAITNPFSQTALAANASVTSRSIALTETSADPAAASRLTAVVTFSDAGGASTANGEALIAALPVSFALSGTVSISAPSSSTRLTGATVTILDGAFAGRSTMTDGVGAFRFTELTGGMSIRASLAGYADQTLSATMTQDRTITFGLRPDLVILDQEFTGNISGGTSTTCSDGIFTKPCVTINLPVHNNGDLEAHLDFGGGSNDLDLTLWRSGTLIAASRQASGTERVSSAVTGGNTYQLRITYYNGSQIAPYTLRVRRPN